MPQPSFLERFRSQLPRREELAAHPWLAPIAARLLDRKLWHAQHEAVARGVAIGTFWAFVIPAGQIIAAAAHCVWWRANIPVAAAITFVTNPFTIGFWLYLAHGVGSFVLEAPPPVKPGPDAGWLDWAVAIGWPAVFGMGLFAVVGALCGYVLVRAGWWLRTRWRVRQRSAARERATANRSV